MFVTVLSVCIFALTRAEIIERFKSPVVTQADGLVRVYANCPEDMRREFQAPVARFAADTVQMLYHGLGKRPVRFAKPGIIVHVGDVRTNVTEVVSSVATNGSAVVTRIWLKSPGYADLTKFRLEVIKGFYRSVEHREVADAEAVSSYRRADPVLRVLDERLQLENWLAGRSVTNDEAGIKLMSRVFEPGKASRRDVLIFASRLFLYPPWHDGRLAGKYDCLSFRDAVRLARADLLARAVALAKADDLPIFGGGRGEELSDAANAYRRFLLEFSAGKANKEDLLELLDKADEKLNIAFERAQKL